MLRDQLARDLWCAWNNINADTVPAWDVTDERMWLRVADWVLADRRAVAERVRGLIVEFLPGYGSSSLAAAIEDILLRAGLLERGGRPAPAEPGKENG